MAKKLESTFTNMVIVLTVVSLIAAYALASVFNMTKEPIEQAALKKKLKAIAEVAPAFDNNPNAEMFKMAAFEPTADDSLEVYPAKKAGKLVGYAVKTYTMKGFSGLIEVMVGFEKDGTIKNYSVLKHAETPGLGTKMGTWFNNEAKPNPPPCITSLSSPPKIVSLSAPPIKKSSPAPPSITSIPSSPKTQSSPEAAII